MTRENKFLPYGRQIISDADIAAVVDVLKSPMLTCGPVVDAFETALQDKLDVEHAVVCMNGTAALHMTATVLELGPNDVAIVPAITFLATANGVALAGAKVVFSDVDAKTGLMTGPDLEDAIVRARKIGRPRAVYPVHLNGQCAPMPEIYDIAMANDLFIVEDACHALGSSAINPDGVMKPVGACSWSHMSTFSFHPVKTIAMGEGGAVTCRDSALAEMLRTFRNHGMTRNKDLFIHQDDASDQTGISNPWYYEMQSLGHNFRAPDINCALGLSQLKRLDTFVAKRRDLVAWYDSLLPKSAPIITPLVRLKKQSPAWHIYPVQIDFAAANTTRAVVMNQLRDCGIGTQVHYIPVPSQPYWRERVETPFLSGAAHYYDHSLTLPLHFQMTSGDIEYVVEMLGTVLGIC